MFGPEIVKTVLSVVVARSQCKLATSSDQPYRCANQWWLSLRTPQGINAAMHTSRSLSIRGGASVTGCAHSMGAGVGRSFSSFPAQIGPWKQRC